VRAAPILFALLLASPAAAQTSSPSPLPSASAQPEPVRAHRAVHTSSAEAQAAFDDGLTLLYAFNPEEARRSFERATSADPTLAIAWWGIAMSHGVNINTSFDAAEQQRGHEAIAHAQSLESAATPADRALIDAAAIRFKYVGAKDDDASARAYRDAMNAAATAFPLDDDVLTLAAEAEMDDHPWDYFSKAGVPTAGTAEIIARLETVLARSPHHIGANHYYIHAVEESPHPERALASADYLASIPLEPAAEHLMHMPAHTYMRVGEYHEAGAANVRALAAYRVYLAGNPAGHADYFGHDCVFGVEAFLMSDEIAAARDVARTCMRHGATMLQVVDLRFHRWDVLEKDDNLNNFALGMLAVARGHLPNARTQLKSVASGTDGNSKIEVDLLTASIARAEGRSADEIAALERAVPIEDDNWYSEPPRFWFPVRESLGGAYFRAGRYGEAEATFRADLVNDPSNPRSLFGLAQTLEKEGRDGDAADVDKKFDLAARHADAPFDMGDL
jgi:tetratricopeptide (TPR) repeat protein